LIDDELPFLIPWLHGRKVPSQEPFGISVPNRPGRPAVGPVAHRLGQMRPFGFRNCAGQADDLTAWGITVGDWADYRLLVGCI
jgi:hypothetical protein